MKAYQLDARWKHRSYMYLRKDRLKLQPWIGIVSLWSEILEKLIVALLNTIHSTPIRKPKFHHNILPVSSRQNSVIHTPRFCKVNFSIFPSSFNCRKWSVPFKFCRSSFVCCLVFPVVIRKYYMGKTVLRFTKRLYELNLRREFYLFYVVYPKHTPFPLWEIQKCDILEFPLRSYFVSFSSHYSVGQFLDSCSSVLLN
jgi:hypothetical protein